MKIFTTTILTMLVSLTAISQNQADSGFTNKTEAQNKIVNGKKEGKWLEYEEVDSNYERVTKDTNAPMYRLAIYKAGKPVGVEREYYKDGKLEGSVYFSNGKQNGVGKVYYENGKLALENALKDGERNGMLKIYYQNGKVKMECNFVNDKMVGVAKEYYESGKIKNETTYKKGKIVSAISYDENGNKM